MTTSDATIAVLIELMAGLGPVKARRMFGGAGLFADGVMFALVIDDVLYLKVDAESRAAFVAVGSRPFTYEGKGGKIEVSYWQAPERLLDDPEEMSAWAARALAIARRAAAAKSKSPRRR